MDQLQRARPLQVSKIPMRTVRLWDMSELLRWQWKCLICGEDQEMPHYAPGEAADEAREHFTRQHRSDGTARGDR